MLRRGLVVISILAISCMVLMPVGLLFGGVDIPVKDVLSALIGSSEDSVIDFIIFENRLPALFASFLSGAALALAGLLMQTCFNNPLAGPSIMGISSGSSLGVGLVILAMGEVAGTWGRMASIGGAFIGAIAVMLVLMAFSAIVRSSDVLLIIGILIGYLTSSAITLLNFFGSERAVHSYVVWGLGSFSGVPLEDIPFMGSAISVLVVFAFCMVKVLNALLLGERYANSVGVSVDASRMWLLLLSGGLTAVVTAWCGPIGFIGLVVPHIARMLVASSNHKVLLPATLFAGGLVGLVCQIISVAPSLSQGGIIPINAITPVIGVPVIVYVLLNRRKLLYFN